MFYIGVNHNSADLCWLFFLLSVDLSQKIKSAKCFVSECKRGGGSSPKQKQHRKLNCDLCQIDDQVHLDTLLFLIICELWTDILCLIFHSWVAWSKITSVNSGFQFPKEQNMTWAWTFKAVPSSVPRGGGNVPTSILPESNIPCRQSEQSSVETQSDQRRKAFKPQVKFSLTGFFMLFTEVYRKERYLLACFKFLRWSFPISFLFEHNGRFFFHQMFIGST